MKTKKLLHNLRTVLCINLLLLFVTALPALALDVNIAWDAPTTNADGTPLTDLRDYSIHRGTATGVYTTAIHNVTTTTYLLTNLPVGTHYVAVTAVDTSGNRSSYSNEIQIVVSSADSDGDGVPDASDCAPTNATQWRNQAYPDPDNDTVRNSTTLGTVACFGTNAPSGSTLNTNGPDNCPTVANTSQTNTDGDSMGDACDSDDDNDSVADASDCAPLVATQWRNTAYVDADNDTVRENSTAVTVACYGTTAPSGYTANANGPDNCPAVANSSQTNTDGDAQGDACDSDDDNDTVADASDCAPTNATQWRNQAYPDSDNDTVRNSTTLGTVACFGTTAPSGSTLNTNGPDNCPTVSNTSQTNTDGDAQGDACDSDDDNDSVTDANDCAPLVATQWRNQAYPDGDNDGVRTSTTAQTVACSGTTAPTGFTFNTNGPDNCATVANSTQTNTDGDAQGDACDSDDDNDTVTDANDCAPLVATQWRNQAYPDTDGDGVRNSTTAQTVACSGTTAPAGFTFNTNGPDNCPNTANPTQTDSDGDGLGDLCDNNVDSDGDGIMNNVDCAPMDATRYRDQAYPDVDLDTIRDSATLATVACFGVTVPPGFTLAANGPDNCPAVANTDQLNTDGDTEGDACDLNDDNDVAADLTDCAPLNASQWQLAYPDADQDGVRNSVTAQTAICVGAMSPTGYTLTLNGPDNCPNVANTNQADSDGDGIGDACEVSPPPPNNDRDGDGIPDASDNCPDKRNANQRDRDNDGIGDACDDRSPRNPRNLPDFNGDGVSDIGVTDPSAGSDFTPVGETSTTQQIVSIPEGAIRVYGDYNGDGMTDLAIAEDRAGSLYWTFHYAGQGSAGATDGSEPIAFLRSKHRVISRCDLDSDGLTDLAGINGRGRLIARLTADGSTLRLPLPATNLSMLKSSHCLEIDSAPVVGLLLDGAQLTPELITAVLPEASSTRIQKIISSTIETRKKDLLVVVNLAGEVVLARPVPKAHKLFSVDSDQDGSVELGVSHRRGTLALFGTDGRSLRKYSVGRNTSVAAAVLLDADGSEYEVVLVQARSGALLLLNPVTAELSELLSIEALAGMTVSLGD